MRTITFLRHGKADKAESDFDRVLGESGMAQAALRREQLGFPEFDAVFASPAPRAIATAAIVSGKPESAIFSIDPMYPHPHTDDGAVIDRAFNELGYAPLSAYLVHKDGEAVRRHGSDTWAALQEEIGDAKGNFLVVGHAVLFPSTGLAACDGTVFADHILEQNTGECCGFRLTFDDWEPQGLELI